MIKKLVEKLKILVEDSEENITNKCLITYNQLDAYYSSLSDKAYSKDELVEMMMELWRKDSSITDGYQNLLVRNQIITYFKGKGRDYEVYLWYFKSDEQPFYVEVRKKHQDSLCEQLENIVKDYPSESVLIKKEISEMKASQIKKQIEYYCLISNIHLFNHEGEN